MKLEKSELVFLVLFEVVECWPKFSAMLIYLDEDSHFLNDHSIYLFIYVYLSITLFLYVLYG